MARKVGMVRQCPRDWTPLAKETRRTLNRKVEVEACPKCHGMYLDKGEIKSLTGQADLHKLLTKYLGLDAGSPLVCPSCGGLMDDEDAGDLKVEVCIRCYGVWVDPGEIERLLAMDEDRYLAFTPGKMAELLKAKDIRGEERKRAFREMFGGLGRVR